jgi:hypothetical protein
MRRLAVDRGRWKEFVEAPLTPWGIMGKRKKKKKYEDQLFLVSCPLRHAFMKECLFSLK